MPASIAAVIEAPSASASGIETTSPSGLGGDGGVDELRHRHHVEGAGRLVLDRDAQVLAGLRDAVLHDRPEGVGRLAVGDDDDANLVVLRRGRLRRTRPTRRP